MALRLMQAASILEPALLLLPLLFNWAFRPGDWGCRVLFFGCFGQGERVLSHFD
jgi:hypothetical protein